jgi:GNAT superfamily N-acetyltransferase
MPESIHIHRVDTPRRRDVRRFIQVPFDLYKDCPQWVPPLVPGMRRALDRESFPIYRDVDAEFFVAEDAGRAVGRIAVIDNHLYNDYHGTKTAFFYYFDAVDDDAVSGALFNAAFDWARTRGLEDVLGPKGLVRFDAHGVLVDGFEHRASVGVPYNYPYYERLVEAAGFVKELDYYSGYLSEGFSPPERLARIAERVMERRGFRVRTFANKQEIWSFLPDAHEIYLKAWKEVPGYYPVNREEITIMMERVVSIADPEMIKLVMKDDKPVGFVISYPDLAAGLQRCNGRLWPFGWFHLMRERKRTEWVTLNGVGLLPEYQGFGANAILYTELAKTLREYGFKYGDYVQVAETNLASLGDASTMGFPLYKTHRIYRRAL